MDRADWESFATVQAAIDSLDDPIFFQGSPSPVVGVQSRFCALIGSTREAMLGRSDPDFFPPEQVEVFWRLDDELFASGEMNENEEQLTDADGRVHTLWTRKYPVRDAAGAVIGLCGVISDITALRERLDQVTRRELAAKERELEFAAQRAIVEAMAVPVIHLWERVLLVPLIGELTEQRAAKLVDVMLSAIAEFGATVVFLDVSGVPRIDARSAQGLVHAVTTARLLGCRAAIVGIGSDAAATLATLPTSSGIGLLETHATLQDGLALVLGAPRDA
ncbi:MAG: PAS domain-containing protein [Nannocystaceae bacterium]